MPACAPLPGQLKPQVINVYASSAAFPWLNSVYNCAPSSVAVNFSGPDSADLSLRLGQPGVLASPAYQIGVDDILVVVNPQVGVAALTLDQAQQLFAGQISNWKDVGGADVPVQVWQFSPVEDIQSFFETDIMQGRPISSLARLAVSAQAMSDGVGSSPGSIGLLPRRWKAGNTREALRVASLPVLAITREEPEGNLRALVHCLQSSK